MHLLEEGTAVADPLMPYAAVDRSRRRDGCWVMGHMVGGLDGSAAIGGRVADLSTAPDAQLFVLMRALADVVMVGAQTVRAEGYGPVRLTEEQMQARRQAGKATVPPLAVVSGSLDLDWSARAFTAAAPQARTLVVTCDRADADRKRQAEKVATVIVAGGERVEPARAMAELAALGHQVILCEGGPTWLGQIVAADRLDELCLSIAPLMGGDALPVSVSPAGSRLARFSLRQVMRDGDTLFLRYERPE